MDRLYRVKDKLIECVQHEMSKGVENVSTHEMGMVIDMIKDISEAEKACAEAEYYESVVDAMEEAGGRYGYEPSGADRSNSRMMRGGDGGEDGRMGYRNQYGNWPANPRNRRRMRRRGYTEESIENVRQMMEEADPARREQLKRDLQELMQEM